MNQEFEQSLRALIKEIVKEVLAEEGCVSGKTPSDFRSTMTADELANRVTETGIPLSRENLRKYETGKVVNIDEKSVVIRMNAIAKVLGVPLEEYRKSVRRMQRSAS